MELHSYAKRKAAKKFTIDQKRKLVEARINYDAMFSNMPTNSVVPWKKILNITKLDDYNVYFIRNQWSNMVYKYKQYKQNRLGNIPSRAIDEEMIQKITQEWEFFRPIHNFMARKTTNLHSYALTAEQEPQNQIVAGQQQPKQQQEHIQTDDNQNTLNIQHQQQTSNSSTERINGSSSDTNEDYMTTRKMELQRLNTDHDFYSKRSPNQFNYFADASEDTQESLMMEVAPDINGDDVKEIIVEAAPAFETNPFNTMKQEPMIDSFGQPTNYIYPTMSTNDKVHGRGSVRRKSRLSERDKYYRHKRHFNRRLEHRFDALLNVFGQIVKAEYPSINVGPLLGATTLATGATVKTVLSSEEEGADSDGESITTDDGEVQMSSDEQREQRR